MVPPAARKREEDSMILASSGDSGRVRWAMQRTRSPGTCQDSSIRTALTFGTTLIYPPVVSKQTAGHLTGRGVGHLLTGCPARILAMLETLLPLERPLVVFDTETTGTNPRGDRIIDIACVKVHPDGHRETWQARFNPGMPIPPGSTAIHGIGDKDVTGCPRFADVAAQLAAFLEGCDLAGYNITGFDLPILRIEFLRAGVPFAISERRLLDAQRIFFAREPRHLTAAARFYCQADHNGAHGALADAEMTLQVLAGELERYPDLPRSIPELHDLFCAGLDQDMDPEGRFRLVNGEPTVNFGRNRGKRLSDLRRCEPDFLRWIVRGDFSEPVKEIARRYLPAEQLELK